MTETGRRDQSAPPTDIKSSHFTKTEERFRKSRWGYSAEYKLGEGATIDNFRIYHRAAVVQGFRFDQAGELNLVYVEKRLLDKTPLTAKEGIKMFKQQSGGEIGSTIGQPPAYKIILTRQEDGKFAVLERSVTSDQRVQWESEFNRNVFRTPPENYQGFAQRIKDTLRRRDLGSSVRSFLIEQNTTQKDLAKKVGIDQALLSRILKGRTKPDVNLALKISNALSLSDGQKQQLVRFATDK